jgi:sugar lactone lactonase YvrE
VGADGAVPAVATPLHGPCVDWPASGADLPTPTPLALGRSSPFAIAADDTNVYWTEDSGIMSVPRDGGAWNRLASATSAHAIAVDAENVYWADSTGVMSVPLGGGTPTKLFSGPTNALGLAVNETHVYWTDATAGTVLRVPRLGGTTTKVATGEPTAMGIALDGERVVWAVGQPGTIETISLHGGEQVKLASDPGSPQQVALDALNVYWTDDGGGTALGTVMEAPLEGGPAITLATGQIDALGIATASVEGAGTYVYWVDGAGGTLMATPAIGGFLPTTMASGLGQPERVAIGRDSIYWTDSASGDVMALACARTSPTPDAGMDAAADATPDAAPDGEPGDSSIDSTVEETGDDASDGSETDAGADVDAGPACSFEPRGLVCNFLQPECAGPSFVQVLTAPPDPSAWRGGTLLPGQYRLDGYVYYGTDPSCLAPFDAMSSVAELTVTDVTSGTLQIATMSELGSSKAVVSETFTESYVLSGATITETTSCPTQSTKVGYYQASNSQLFIGNDVTFVEPDGGPCESFAIRVYDQTSTGDQPPDDAGASSDARPGDAGITGAAE